jgi:hypothetical protein
MGQDAPRPLPNPNIILVGVEYTTLNGKDIVRYRYDVFNRDDYPNSLFASSPSLPPCGSNTNASRTWVDFFDQSGKRLNGFCALADSKSLSGIWFALEANVVPPSWVYMEMTDRQANRKYKSNLAETTQ